MTNRNRLKVTFVSYSKILKKTFRNVEWHASEANASLRAKALGWDIESIAEEG